MKMKQKYDVIQSIFIQSSLTRAFLEQKLKSLPSNFMISGEVNYWFWRYVYMKDITKKAFTNKLLKLGLDNLTVVEIVDVLNTTRNMVKEILEDAKKDVK